MKIERPLKWKVVRAHLDPIVGSEQAGIRPVLIVSAEAINDKLPVVAILPLTSRKPGRQVYSTEVLLPAGIAGQPTESVVMAHQVRVISTDRILGSYGRLTDKTLQEGIREAMRIYLDLLDDASFDEEPLELEPDFCSGETDQ